MITYWIYTNDGRKAGEFTQCETADSFYDEQMSKYYFHNACKSRGLDPAAHNYYNAAAKGQREMNIAKEVVEYAVKHQISLGKDEHGYYIRNPQTQQIVERSNSKSIKSAVIMMKRFLGKPPELRYWQ